MFIAFECVSAPHPIAPKHVAGQGSPRCHKRFPLAIPDARTHCVSLAIAIAPQTLKSGNCDSAQALLTGRTSAGLCAAFFRIYFFSFIRRKQPQPCPFVLAFSLDGFEPLDLVREALRLVNFGQLNTSTQVTTPAEACRGLLLLPKIQLVGLTIGLHSCCGSITRWRGTSGFFDGCHFDSGRCWYKRR